MSKQNQRPWYQRVYRWGQTNLTEIDPIRYDAEWWREYWRETKIQGIIVNAGGIVFYYPSKYEEVHRAEYLGERDLFGEITELAREEGLAVLARMDSNVVHEKFYLQHPDWCAIDKEGNPYRSGGRYVTCVNSLYYKEFIPNILKEIVEKYQPEGLTDNSYSGLDRNNICYCENCQREFRDATGLDLPHAKNWDDRVYKEWIRWSYACRVRNWDINNEATKSVGGPDCLWIGMNSGDMINQGIRLRDSKALFERTKIVMADHQSRPLIPGFRQNAEAGKLIHGLAGWDVLIPESMAMYQHGHGQPVFRVASKPVPEVRLWSVSGFAGGIQPWWHHIGAYHEDRRQYTTAKPLFDWHEENEDILVDRLPVADVGVIWSQENADFYGKDEAESEVAEPFTGVTQALSRARIPYIPVHADQIEEVAKDLRLLILPNVGAMSEKQVTSIKAFVNNGGNLIASGQTSLFDEWGDKRSDFALADVLGVHYRAAQHGKKRFKPTSFAFQDQHSYFRLHPELRKQVYGPQVGDEPEISGERHDILMGFEETDILPFGGALQLIDVGSDAVLPISFIPPFPVYPPEFSYMREFDTGLPAVVLRETPSSGRVAYLAADIDRLYGRDNLPDHGRLLTNIIRWALHENVSMEIEGTGYLDCHLYRQPERLILHLVNLTNTESWRAAVHEFVQVGPFEVRVRVPKGISGDVSLRVSGNQVDARLDDGWIVFELPSIVDHEVVVVE